MCRVISFESTDNNNLFTQRMFGKGLKSHPTNDWLCIRTSNPVVRVRVDPMSVLIKVCRSSSDELSLV